MSFLAEVLCSVEKVEIENVHKIVPEIDFTRPARNDQLLNTSANLVEELANLNKSVSHLTKRDIPNVKTELHTLREDLEKSDFAFKVSSQLLHIHETLVAVRNFQNVHSYQDACKGLLEITQVVEGLPECETTEALDKLMYNVTLAKAALVNKLAEVFDDNLIIDDNQTDKMEMKSLKVRKANNEIVQVFAALVLLEVRIQPLHKLSEFLWKNIIVPIVKHTTVVNTFEDGDYNILTVDVRKGSNKLAYKDVFDRIECVTGFLHEHFNYVLNEELHVAEYLGNLLREKLSELLIKDCLSDTIPSNEEGLQNYAHVIEDTATFQENLVKYNFCNKNSTTILDYANNIDIHFINKRCQEYLTTAMSLMKKDLHDMIEVGVPHDITKPLDCTTVDEFPQCSVSRSTIDLIRLCGKMMEEAVKTTDVAAGRLFCTVQNIFGQYGAVVCEHHKKLLKTIPQQVALFHNNCMYLSHELTQWNETYRGKLSPLICAPPIFKIQHSDLWSIGSTAFEDYIQNQVENIENIIKESGLSKLKLSEKLDPGTEKSIRQCLRQQELLKTVWQKVLSYSVYNRSLGSILNLFCLFLITPVVQVEDIPSETAQLLVDVYKVVLTRGPKLFSDAKEINLYVENWYKLNELVFILSSSLVDINDRWADGKGPLALQFTSEEVKGLIRALFQNTDRRAAILNKIHD